MSFARSDHGTLFPLAMKMWLWGRAFKHRVLRASSRHWPETPRHILISHQLLLGDALMLTLLLARLRQRYPDARIVVAMPWAQVPLYASQPYGIEAWPFDAKDRASVEALLNKAAQQGGFDLALVPGENRYALFAAACGARWIVALEGGETYKNWWVDALKPWPTVLQSLADIFASLAGDEEIEQGAHFTREEWPTPPTEPFSLPGLLPERPYAVLHVGASNPNKLWPAAHWQQLAQALHAAGMQVIWSGGRSEVRLVESCDPQQQFINAAGKLNLAQMWQLLEAAKIVVAPDTGIAHLARVIGTPTVAIFGPGLTKLYAGCGFWAHQPFQAVVLSDMPARYQATLFKRKLPWLADHAAARLPAAIAGQGYMPVRDAVWQMLGWHESRAVRSTAQALESVAEKSNTASANTGGAGGST